jgi:2,3,4,5-tetrahydropyridine-2,6-dicarboxylate N-succinyltransferase
MTTCFAWGIGLGSYSQSGTMLDCFFPAPLLRPDASLAKRLTDVFGTGVTEVRAGELARILQHLAPSVAAALAPLADAERPLVSVLLEEDRAITHTAEAYLKLHLLSHRLVEHLCASADSGLDHSGADPCRRTACTPIGRTPAW